MVTPQVMLIVAAALFIVLLFGFAMVWALWRRSRSAAQTMLIKAEEEARRIVARAETEGQRLDKDAEIRARERLLQARMEFERGNQGSSPRTGCVRRSARRGTGQSERTGRESRSPRGRIVEDGGGTPGPRGAARAERERTRGRGHSATPETRTDCGSDRGAGEAGAHARHGVRGPHGRRRYGQTDRGRGGGEGQGEGPARHLHGDPADRVRARGRKHRERRRPPVGRDEGPNHRP
jgi:hypothetical protein